MANKKKKKKTKVVVASQVVGNIVSTAYDKNKENNESTTPVEEVTNRYVVTITHNTKVDNIIKLMNKNKDIIGVCVEAGQLFNSIHVKQPNVTPVNFNETMEKIVSNAIPFSFYFTVRARNLNEIREEIYALSFIVRKYPPQLGLWLSVSLTSSVATNDILLDEYYERLCTLGFKGQLGLYLTPAELKTITWKKHSDEWWLWIINRYKKVSELSQRVKPELFDVEE